MEQLIQLLTGTLGALGFALVYNVHGKKLIFTALGGTLSCGLYLLGNLLGFDVNLSAFIASAALMLYSEWMARLFKSPVTVFMVIAAISLIPGAGLYRTADAMLHGNWDQAGIKGLETLRFAASMSAGISLVSLCFHMLKRQRR